MSCTFFCLQRVAELEAGKAELEAQLGGLASLVASLEARLREASAQSAAASAAAELAAAAAAKAQAAVAEQVRQGHRGTRVYMPYSALNESSKWPAIGAGCTSGKSSPLPQTLQETNW